MCFAKKEDNQKRGKEFYFGKGDCERKYEPDYSSLNTPLSEGGQVRQFIYNERKIQAALETLSALTMLTERNNLSLKEKIDVQQTLWDFITGLQYTRGIKTDPDPAFDQAKIDKLITQAFLLLDKVLLNNSEIKALSNSSDVFDFNSTNKDVSNIYIELKKGSGYFVEDIFPWLFHSLASGGAVYERIFIGFDKKDSFDSFGKFLVGREHTLLHGVFGRNDKLQSKNTPTMTQTDDLSLLPRDFSHLHNILITYLNVLDKNYNVIPTTIIAKWSEIWFSKTVNNEGENLDFADPYIYFRALDYKKSLYDNEQGTYKIQDMQSMGRLTFFNVNPSYPNFPATTLRGNCLSCHTYRVKDFHVHRRAVGFSKPFSLPFSYYQSFSEYGSKTEAKLKEWRHAYLP